jgi:folate-binding protein YgfZ
MNREWSRYLEQLQWPASSHQAHCAFSNLADRGLIRISGGDALDFLQGQLTNDIRKVTPEQGQLSAYCTPKGRMLALFQIFRSRDTLLLELPRERLEPVLKRLQLFVLRADVKLEEVSDELVISGLAGACCSELLPALPDTPFATTDLDGLTLMRIPGDVPRCKLIGSAEASIAFWEKHRQQVQPVDGDFWPLLDIRAGLPQVYDATAEAFVPQMCNLDLLDAISFTKGCYTGQEVVARMKYLGQLKRRMFWARLAGARCPAPGEPLFSPSSQSAQGAGKVVDARPSPGDGCEALVVAELAGFEAGDLRLGDQNGASLELREPPYGLTSEEAQ